MLRLTNPIPQAIKDTDDLKQVISSLKLVPYYGSTNNSSHTFLQLLYDLYELSPSHGTCINDVSDFSFNGDIDLKGSRFAGFTDTEPVLSNDIKNQFGDALNEVGLKFFDISKLTKEGFKHGKVSGNKYIHARFFSVGDEMRVFLDVIHPKKVMYIVPDDDDEEEVRSVVITDKWTQQNLADERKHKIIRVFPHFTENEDYQETIFHFKAVEDESGFYGRPDTLQSVQWQMVEHQIASHGCKTASTELTAKMLLAFEGLPAGEIEEKKRAARVKEKGYKLRQFVSNEGETPNSIAVIEYGHGGRPPTAIPIDIDRDSDWFEAQREAASEYIFGSHRWSRQLNGFKDSKSNLGGEVLKNIALIKNETVIVPYQEQVSAEWTVILGALADFTGNEIFREITFQFPDNLGRLIEQFYESPVTERGDPVQQD